MNLFEPIGKRNTIFQFQFTGRLKLLGDKKYFLVTFTKDKNKRIQLLLSPQQECYYTFITLPNQYSVLKKLSNIVFEVGEWNGNKYMQ